MGHPITAHCVEFQHDEDGGYVIEATTIQARSRLRPLCRREWAPLGPAPRRSRAPFRYWNGSCHGERRQQLVRRWGEDGKERLDVDFQPAERERIDNALGFSREVLEAAGATQVCWTGLVSTHAQGGCRMGDDPARRSSTGTASRTR